MSQADTSFDCISNLTEIAGLAYSPSTNALVNRTCMDIMESVNACSSRILDDSDMPTQAQSPNEIVSEPREPSDSNEPQTTTRRGRQLQRNQLQGKRPKQPQVKQCVLCLTKVANLRQHFSKSHNLTTQQRKFLLSFYATRICVSTVYQCNGCFIRFTGKKKHKKNCRKHEIIKVNPKSMDEFPSHFRFDIPGIRGKTFNHHKLLDEYDENRNEAGDENMTRFQKTFLAQILSGTSFLRKPEAVKSTFYRIKSEKNYTFQTMRKLMFEFNRFLEFCNSYKQKELRFNMALFKGEVRNLLKKTAKEASKEVNRRMQARFDSVPNLYQVSHLRQMVKEMLGQNVYSSFTYLEYLCLLVFVIHSESNCRIGALLNLTFEDYKVMQEKKVMTSFEHKTGAKFPNFIRITKENRKWVDDLHQYFQEENNGLTPKLAFPSNTNKKFTCQAKYFKEAIYKYFRIDDKLYNPDNVRKAWDTFFEKSQFVTGQNALLYQMNTGHCEATRRKYYLKPATDNEIESFLDEQLKIIDDPESCYVAEDDPPPPPPVEQEDNPEQHESEEETMDKGNVGDTQEENVDGGALTPDNEDANNNSLVIDEDDMCEDDAPTPIPSDQDDEDYKPDPGVKVKWETERTLKTRENDATKWEAIGEKLMKFTGPADPLQPFLEELFTKVVAAQFYTGRGQLRDLCKLMKLSNADREKVLDKATKKLSNVMKNTKN